jgi:hypothetical protein
MEACVSTRVVLWDLKNFKGFGTAVMDDVDDLISDLSSSKAFRTISASGALRRSTMSSRSSFFFRSSSVLICGQRRQDRGSKAEWLES